MWWKGFHQNGIDISVAELFLCNNKPFENVYESEMEMKYSKMAEASSSKDYFHLLVEAKLNFRDVGSPRNNIEKGPRVPN